jgi:hypothetical protein
MESHPREINRRHYALKGTPITIGLVELAIPRGCLVKSCCDAPAWKLMRPRDSCPFVHPLWLGRKSARVHFPLPRCGQSSANLSSGRAKAISTLFEPSQPACVCASVRACACLRVRARLRVYAQYTDTGSAKDGDPCS